MACTGWTGWHGLDLSPSFSHNMLYIIIIITYTACIKSYVIGVVLRSNWLHDELPLRDSVCHNMCCCTFSGSRRPQSLWGPSTPPLTPALTSLCWTHLEKRLCSERCASVEVRAILFQPNKFLLQSWCQTSSWNVLKYLTKWMVLSIRFTYTWLKDKLQCDHKSVWKKWPLLHVDLMLLFVSENVCLRVLFITTQIVDDWDFHLLKKSGCNKNRSCAFWNKRFACSRVNCAVPKGQRSFVGIYIE